MYGLEGFIKVLRNAEKKMGKIFMKKKVWGKRSATIVAKNYYKC